MSSDDSIEPLDPTAAYEKAADVAYHAFRQAERKRDVHYAAMQLRDSAAGPITLILKGGDVEVRPRAENAVEIEGLPAHVVVSLREHIANVLERYLRELEA